MLSKNPSPIFLPFSRVDHSPPLTVFTHGLGSSHTASFSSRIVTDTLSSCHASYLTYTARGHGESTGWQDTAVSDAAQFTWRRLAGDMITMADNQGIDKFIAGGSSMGAGTALWTAVLHPKRITGLILVLPPTAWEERAARRSAMVQTAQQGLEANPSDMFQHVVKGTAYSDLPERADMAAYSNIKCPVLILAVEGDTVHPLSTAEALRRLIPQAGLHVARDMGCGEAEWGETIASFIEKIRQSEKEMLSSKKENA